MSGSTTSGFKTPEAFMSELRELIAAQVSGNVQLMTRMNDFLGQVSQRITSGALRRPTDASELLSKWLEFNLASYSVVSAQGLALLNGLLDAAERTFVEDTAAAETEAGPKNVELRMSARPGERASCAFLIENQFDKPLRVTVESSELVSPKGVTLPATHVVFDPESVELGPRQQAMVQAAIVVTSAFAPGEVYRGTVRVRGLRLRELSLALEVREPDPDGPKVTAGKASPPRTRKRRKGTQR